VAGRLPWWQCWRIWILCQIFRECYDRLVPVISASGSPLVSASLAPPPADYWGRRRLKVPFTAWSSQLERGVLQGQHIPNYTPAVTMGAILEPVVSWRVEH